MKTGSLLILTTDVKQLFSSRWYCVIYVGRSPSLVGHVHVKDQGPYIYLLSDGTLHYTHDDISELHWTLH